MAEMSTMAAAGTAGTSTGSSTDAGTRFRRSPGGHLAEAVTAGSGTAVRLREIPFQTMVALRVEPGTDAAARVEAALGLPLPAACGDVTGSTEGTGAAVLWLGPDEFLVVGPEDALPAPADLVGRLADALGDVRGQAVDVSANRTTLELAGTAAREVLEKSVTFDLHPRALPAGRAYATLLGPVQVVLWKTREEPEFRILPRGSFTEYTVALLLDSMAEFH
ncbi:sarcosine oxidase subunit gamma [Tersicoccus solisilvae]|uniref:Sarcosine oxidase subunit gamma n=1 Tax=Tersicoccus solisilvae TaxID=1882339 RepID=A0ABQ1PB29_9MICC|nr:sarcosine oxidase subunit gamma family protein [Tersicoccus solisilvae]GGC93490.1 sarcosine oxidase subunit gamma [Tersicoccus solisilvae]